ncbi:tRNA (adenosine(37)-N6)-dimethylallyltransferase MiaA [Novipirellula artificiosorum]|nr:tRNA (adenosine(37)-N6)-dimethylallyltransferase MiaA [Novipirellula artificiosorum]
MDDAIRTFAPLVDRVIVITGPTASGKSSIGMELASQIGGEILSLDSIAVYRQMDIGTAKPSAADRSRVPHHLIDLVDPNESFSVACYLKAAHAVVDRLQQQGKPAIFVGGTPMFLKGVLRGFDPGPPADETFRSAVEQDLAKHGVEALRQRLLQVDPLAAHRIGPRDARRMIRALEVAHHTGKPLSHRQVQFDQSTDASSCNVFWMRWDRKTLHQRINRRVDQMFEEGLVDEVNGLLQSNRALSKTAAQAVGYRELIECCEHQRSGVPETEFKQAREDIATHTRQLAKRQETWFRSFTELRPIQLTEPVDPVAVARTIADSLV